jgi:hypothetical protein
VTIKITSVEDEGPFSIRNCIWGVKCDRSWGNLKQTEDPTVRFCGHCQKEVFLCEDDESLIHSIIRNRCIAIDPESFSGDFPYGGNLIGSVAYGPDTD